MGQRKAFLLRISAELYQAIEAWAHSDMRSVNGQIEFLLREAVRRHGGRQLPSPSDPSTDEASPGTASPPGN